MHGKLTVGGRHVRRTHACRSDGHSATAGTQLDATAPSYKARPWTFAEKLLYEQRRGPQVVPSPIETRLPHASACMQRGQAIVPVAVIVDAA